MNSGCQLSSGFCLQAITSPIWYHLGGSSSEPQAGLSTQRFASSANHPVLVVSLSLGWRQFSRLGSGNWASEASLRIPHSTIISSVQDLTAAFNYFSFIDY